MGNKKREQIEGIYREKEEKKGQGKERNEDGKKERRERRDT